MVFYLIFGSMYSGKTTRMFEMLSKNAYRNSNDVCLFKHKKDDRYEKVQTHSKLIFDSVMVSSATEIANHILNSSDFKAIGIDEGHFYQPAELRKIILKLMIERPEMDIYVTTLQSDWQGNMMNCVRVLLPIAEEIIHQKGICEICRNPRAIVSDMYQKKYSGNNELQLVGGKDIYRAICIRCSISCKDRDQ